MGKNKSKQIQEESSDVVHKKGTPTEWVKIQDLKLLGNNPRRISQINFEKMCNSLKGNPGLFWNRPCLVNNITGENIIYSGNQRYKAAIELGWDSVPAIVESLSKEQEAKNIIADNVNLGEWDYEILSTDEEFKHMKFEEMGLDVPTWKFEDDGQIVTDPKKEWKGMPAYDVENKGPIRQILVSFATQEDVEKFGELMEQNLTDKTKSIWYPKNEHESVVDKEYTDESNES